MQQKILNFVINAANYKADDGEKIEYQETSKNIKRYCDILLDD
jgi:hypothetical protein